MNLLPIFTFFVVFGAFGQQDQNYEYTHKKWGTTEKFIVGRNQKEVGYISYMKKSSNIMQLCMLEVDKEHRNKGLASQLMHYALEQMNKSGCYKIALIATPNDEDTDFNRLVKFYRNFGFIVKEDFGCGSAEMEKKL